MFAVVALEVAELVNRIRPRRLDGKYCARSGIDTAKVLSRHYFLPRARGLEFIPHNLQALWEV